LRNSTAIAIGGARWIQIVDKVFAPIVTLLETATKFILRLLPQKQSPRAKEPPSPVEIDHLSTHTQQYVLNLVGVESRRLCDVMIPLANVTSIPETATTTDVVEVAIRSGHTRLPVFRNSKVIDLLHTKEVIAMLATHPQEWQPLIRPVITLRENDIALSALRVMQDKRSHLLNVENVKGEPLGIVTLEDIIEDDRGRYLRRRRRRPIEKDIEPRNKTAQLDSALRRKALKSLGDKNTRAHRRRPDERPLLRSACRGRS
jgi:CBS domain containing-hemolysin-like protein